jgi:hypothetical protein
MSMAMDMHTTIEELLGAVFFYVICTEAYGKSCRDNTRGLNVVVVMLTTIHVTKLPLWHKISMSGMN